MRLLLTLFAALTIGTAHAQKSATVMEYNKVFKTYLYSDPDPIPRVGNIYPYFRFDGYSDVGVDKSWKVVELSNDYISLIILPEIGGKIWTATDKSTGKDFLYNNHVVKFRDIAMRGPWTSGGIEPNYGIIGHTPNCATPVDYQIKTNDDGSASCFIGTLDLLTRTYWTIEVNLPKDKAYFTTRSFWSNTTSMEQPYYTWMNVGIKAAGNLEFVYPGTHYLGHDGSNHRWPIHEGNGKNISFYEQNNFGPYKSYHVFGKYTNFFGGFWHSENFGMGRYAPHEDKAGKKIWIWGLSQQGMIWEKLLSDTDGQYVEVQSGRLYNQTDHTSSSTPFKHRGFKPNTTDTWTEHWFPVKGTQGFVTASPAGALNVRVRKGFIRIDISPLSAMKETLVVKQGQYVLLKKDIELKILETFRDSAKVQTDEPIEVVLGDRLIEYTTDPNAGVLSRPLESPKDFDWASVQGLHLEGKEFIRERQYTKASEKLEQCLAKDPNYLPALVDLGMICYRNTDFAAALKHLTRALGIDTYEPRANFYFGLTQVALAKLTDARDGFDIAAQDPDWRSSAYAEISRMELKAGRLVKAIQYAGKSLESNYNLEASLLLLAARNRSRGEALVGSGIPYFEGPMNHFVDAENYLKLRTEESSLEFTTKIKNELAVETYLEIAAWYSRLGFWADAKAILDLAPKQAEVLFWQAFLESKLGQPFDKSLERAVAAPVEYVFPFRAESTEVFTWAMEKTENWKPKYFLGLICWNHNQLTRARELFKACEGKPEFSPFYAARAELIPETALADLTKASNLYPNQWRYGKMLIQHYISEKKYTDALKIAQTYDKRIPKDFRLRLLLAKTHLLTENYAACNEVLMNTKVLPYEGSTEGHALYREAWLMQAIAKIKARKFTDALAMISRARLYPVNLGVGKPYDENIDSRIEFYLEGLCYEGMKQTDKAGNSWSAVSKQSHANDLNLLVTAWALKKQNNEAAGKAMLNAWVNQSPGPVAKWCMDVFDGKAAAWEFGTEPDGSRLVEEMITLVR